MTQLKNAVFQKYTLFGLFLFFSVILNATETKNMLKPTGAWTAYSKGHSPLPPLGWNSWHAFETSVNEDKVMGNAEALISTGLADLGYEYINIDDGWWLKRRQSDGQVLLRTSIYPSTKVDGPSHSSFKSFVTKLHGMGLKAGIYTDLGRNVCSQTNPNNPNLPEGNTAGSY